MEVLHASAPGARVRVVRAAYHSTAGPGAPAASCLMHSSRRVISSGFNLLESPSFPSKPLEISSTPLESTPESNTDVENYKVTEPDDFDISEPSKWRSSIGGSSVRMPSEESSSTDNASIIDLDSRTNHKSIFRKSSYDSENSDIPSTRRNSSRMSPLLDAPVALSTLKYKSLLNGSNDWNSRRKSYSFEDTSPLNETIVHSNDTLAMESSTDSGICKSSEIVNDTDDKYYDRKERKYDKQEENFNDWLSKNRPITFYKGNHMKLNRECDVVVEHPQENSIALQSTGKLSITVPITVDEDYYKRTQMSDNDDRRVKKVEFCKTELHFAAESGRVNIIATDEKPPPSNDFRKRRSAFVPIHGNFEKPITLFGEVNKEFPEGVGEFPTFTNSEIGEFDENTAATKSILKNKIPKPKPYLLGENMAFGCSNSANKKENINFEATVPTAVTLINSQLQSRRYSDEEITDFTNITDASVINTNAFRISNKGPARNDSLKLRKKVFEIDENSLNHIKDTVRNKLSVQMSPTSGRAKTRQLRDSDLTYFGIDRSPTVTSDIKPQYESRFKSENSGMDFHSVRLIQQVSNSVCNSEAESEPDYQNVPIKTNFAPVPTPRSRSKYEGQQEIRILKPVIEQESDTKLVSDFRRSRHRRQDEILTSSRSISEPPKINRNSIEKPSRRHHLRTLMEKRSPSPTRSSKKRAEEKVNNDLAKSPVVKKRTNVKTDLYKESDPLYVNISVENTKKRSTDSSCRKSDQRNLHVNTETNTKRIEHKTDSVTSKRNSDYKQEPDGKNKEKRERTDSDKDSLQKKKQFHRKKSHVQRTEKLSTPEYPTNQRKSYDRLSIPRKSSNEKLTENSHTTKQERGSRSTQRHSKITTTGHEVVTEGVNKPEHMDSKKSIANKTVQNHDSNYNTRKVSRDKSGGRKEPSKTDQKLDTNFADSHHNSTKSGNKEINTSDRNPKTDKSSKRSEYVINYDDKNGTVSSICKVKVGHGTSKTKMAQRENARDVPKEQKTKIKSADKVSLRK